MRLMTLSIMLATFAGSAFAAADERTVTVGVVGLFAANREADFRTAVEATPGLKLVSVNLETAEATIAYDIATVKELVKAKPEQAVKRIDEWVRNRSKGLFSLRDRGPTSKDKLVKVEVNVEPLDCQACALAVHEIVMKVDGVTQAIIDMKVGKVSALIDPAKTDRDKLRSALKSRDVTLRGD